MRVLIDASETHHAPFEGRFYAREAFLHVVESGEGHEFGLARARGRRNEAVEEWTDRLSRPARARLLGPDGPWDVVYSPLGLPRRGCELEGLPPAVGTALCGVPRARDAGAAVLIAPTRAGREALLDAGHDPARVHWIPPGLDPPDLAQPKNAEVRIPRGPYVLVAPPRRLESAWVVSCLCLHSALRRVAARTGISAQVAVLRGGEEYARARLVASSAAYVLWNEAAWLQASEALRLGVPVVAARGPLAMEVLGDAAAYFAPGSASSLARALEDALRDGPQRRLLALRGVTRSLAFPWEASARRVLEVIARAARPVAAPASVPRDLSRAGA